MWKLPEAAAWGRAEHLVVARYVKTSMAVERMLTVVTATGKTPQGLSSMQSEIRQIEDRLGLTPMAKLRLRWAVSTDELAEKRDENAETKAPAQRRRLRAVDPGAVAGT
jgi:hypothetical protein